MTTPVNQIEAVSRQLQSECSDESARRQLLRDKHVAADANPLSGDHSVDRMEFLPEAQVPHLIELRYIAPPVSGRSQPPSPRRSFGNEGGPMLVNEHLPPEV